jgi:anti-sigma B factor antagonist
MVGDSMNIWQEEISDGVRLVGVSGRLDQNLTPILEAELLGLLEQGHNRLIVNLHDVNYINSGGLRCLVTAWRQARQNGGDLKLCGLSERVAKIFSMVGFNRVFQIFEDCEAAREAI